MLQVNGVSKAFGDKTILNEVSFILNRGQRAGLVGPNGCGKTTLLRIILGEIAADAGHVTLSPASVRVGYLAQALEYPEGATLGQVLQQSLSATTRHERKLQALSEEIAQCAGAECDSLLAEYERVLAELESGAASGVRDRADTVLQALDLLGLDPAMPVVKLSGGQKTRLGLASLLVSEPDLLLLDEPTNHLDFEMLAWLERFLCEFRGAVLIVSHDRALLDHVTGTILELRPIDGTLNKYPGNYSDYFEAKQREREKQMAAYKDQQEFIARQTALLTEKKNYARSIEQGTIHFHPRKIAKGIARRAVVQQRRIQRLLDSEERVDKPRRAWDMRAGFGEAQETGRDVLRIEGVSMSFEATELFCDVSLTLRAGERTVLVGRNGSGKTTLLRLLVGELAPQSGSIHWGSGVVPGYFAQEQDVLDNALSAYETIRAVGTMDSRDTRNFLHRFLFAGDDVFVPAGLLSFGERSRLILARLIAQGCNVLLLDEPFNHLDIPSRHQFEQALGEFAGTVLAVVHDRYFIERFATGLWGIDGTGIRRYVDLEDMWRVRPPNDTGRE